MRPRPALAVSAVLTALALTLTPATATALTAGPGDPPVVHDEHAGALDVRNGAASVVPPTEAQLAAVADVVSSAGGARVTWDRRFGTPRTVLAAGRDLTGPASGTAAERRDHEHWTRVVNESPEREQNESMATTWDGRG